jgi:protein-S-isoprenylcysteine O-methyltransferase Ste14
VRVPPPIVAAACLLGAAALHFLVPVARFPFPFPGHQVIGGGIIVCGLLLSSIGIRHFRRHYTTVEPFGTPTALVTTGPYRFTRNPMYLGIVLTLSGIALTVATLPFLLAPLAFFLIINATQIPREEATLTGIFGDEYTRYRQRVRRWL